MTTKGLVQEWLGLHVCREAIAILTTQTNFRLRRVIRDLWLIFSESEDPQKIRDLWKLTLTFLPRIQGIKLIRDVYTKTGRGLRDAKDFYEELIPPEKEK
jgi:hypothetical protein